MKEIELLEQLSELVHQRKKAWHKEALTDVFKNGRFWEVQEIWEVLQDYLQEQKKSTPPSNRRRLVTKIKI